jgi:hypothetical protein
MFTRFLLEHRNQLNQKFDEIEINRDLFRQMLTEQINETKKHALIQQIDQWEHDSIMKIKKKQLKKLEKCFVDITTAHVTQIETRLNSLTNRLRESRDEKDFFEIDLSQWKEEELVQMTEELIKPLDITLRQDSTALVTKIYIDIPFTKSGRYACFKYIFSSLTEISIMIDFVILIF